jgi:hypothetical protein
MWSPRGPAHPSVAVAPKVLMAGLSGWAEGSTDGTTPEDEGSRRTDRSWPSQVPLRAPPGRVWPTLVVQNRAAPPRTLHTVGSWSGVRPWPGHSFEGGAELGGPLVCFVSVWPSPSMRTTQPSGLPVSSEPSSTTGTSRVIETRSAPSVTCISNGSLPAPVIHKVSIGTGGSDLTRGQWPPSSPGAPNDSAGTRSGWHADCPRAGRRARRDGSAVPPRPASPGPPRPGRSLTPWLD